VSYQNRTLFVVHIPKAAGTTLRTIVERQVPSQNLYKIAADIQGDQIRFRELSEKKRRAYRVVFGHFCYGLHTALPKDQKYTYITLLRDPVERAISEWAYIRTGTLAHYLGKAARQMELEEFVSSGVTSTLDNGMVRQLCGQDSFKMTDGKQIPGDDMVLPFGSIDMGHLARAKANIKRDFALVGTSERFKESLALMQKLFAWRIPHYTNQNVSSWKPKNLKSSTVAKIVEHNELDYELYRWALWRLGQMIEGPGI
jgi:hypothetical protein